MRRSKRITWFSWSYSYLLRLPVGISITMSMAVLEDSVTASTVPAAAKALHPHPTGCTSSSCEVSTGLHARLIDQPSQCHTREMAKPRPSPRVIAAIVVAHLAITSLTWRDIRNRPDDQIRGSKKIWRVATGANTTNSLVYFLFGRRRSHLPGSASQPDRSSHSSVGRSDAKNAVTALVTS